MSKTLVDEPRILSELIELAAAEMSKSNLVAALELHKMFSHLAESGQDKFFPASVCWVRGPKGANEVNERYRVPRHEISEYMNNCMFQRTLDCVLPDGKREAVKDEFIAFDPASLINELENSGYSWIPRRGVYHHSEIPEEPSETAVEGLMMPYETPDIMAMHLAANKFWIDFDKTRPPLQKTVSSFIAEQLKLEAPNRKTDALAAAIRPLDAPNER
ncbi:hypothetical protein ACIPZF_08220 [Pseudomonas sp. NPDC089752]|uniref:hypothetical protein n=1 Tax=Pseudomonas sp. NPDC089752 TaxID=3364472 RepID=UPI0038223F86